MLKVSYIINELECRFLINQLEHCARFSKVELDDFIELSVSLSKRLRELEL